MVTSSASNLQDLLRLLVLDRVPVFRAVVIVRFSSLIFNVNPIIRWNINTFNSYHVGNRASDQFMRELGLVRGPVKLKNRISVPIGDTEEERRTCS